QSQKTLHNNHRPSLPERSFGSHAPAGIQQDQLKLHDRSPKMPNRNRYFSGSPYEESIRLWKRSDLYEIRLRSYLEHSGRATGFAVHMALRLNRKHVCPDGQMQRIYDPADANPA